MRGSRKFCQRVSNFDNFFKKFMKGGRIQIPPISGPSSACHRNAISMAFPWRADYGPTLNDGLVACDFSEDPDQYC